MPELRAARKEDAPLLARVLEMAGRGHLPRGPWDLLFPGAADRERALGAIATGPVSWCHWSVFHVAEIDGEAGAALCAFEPGAIGGTDLGPSLATAILALGWKPERLLAGAGSLAPYLRCFPDMPPGTWIVENVGALPSHRRRGLVGALLDRALAEGRRRGLRRAEISCLVGNDAAHLAYRRAGFEESERFEDPAFEALLGAPGFVRMTRSLEDTP